MQGFLPVRDARSSHDTVGRFLDTPHMYASLFATQKSAYIRRIHTLSTILPDNNRQVVVQALGRGFVEHFETAVGAAPCWYIGTA